VETNGLIAVGAVLLLLAIFLAVPAWGDDAFTDSKSFRVCADPNNLPFSNRNQEGFENKIAALLARELDQQVAYTWWPQRRGFIRNTLSAGVCDIVMGVPVGYDPVLTTQPYYRSTYVFVYPKSAGFQISSFDDPILHKLKIGVHLIGDDYANSPPAHLLSTKGIVKNVVGYSVFGNYAEESPPGKIINAVATGEVDMAIVWGPIAGYFAQQQTVPLVLAPVPADASSSSLPFSYSISLGVRRQDKELRVKLDDALQRKASEIRKVLQDYGVPLLSGQPSAISGQLKEN
jgi:quinoprotein dehydrogenase-associated probable ABC transporter substrate-binding protein